MKSIKNPEHPKKGGRPRKYAEPSQPVTVTLPSSTLRELHRIDPDRGRAIVKLARAASSQQPPLVELVEFAEHAGLVVVGPCAALLKVPFVQLVEVAPLRYLLALSSGHDFHQLEIALGDLLEDPGIALGDDRELIAKLLSYFKNFRKTESMSTAQIVLVQLDANR